MTAGFIMSNTWFIRECWALVTSFTSLRRFAGLYRMQSQRVDGRSPCVLILRSSASAMFTQTLARSVPIPCASQQNTLGRYIRRITVNVIEAYYKAKNITNVIIGDGVKSIKR